MAQYKEGQQGMPLFIKPLEDNELLINLGLLKRVLLSSYGRNARTKIIMSSQNSDIKVGSSSDLLLNSCLINSEDAIVKLIMASVKNHLKVYYDFGLYCSVLCLSLVESGLKSDIPSCLVAQCFQRFLQDINFHFNERKNCDILQKIDISKMDRLVQLVGSVLQSKPGLMLKFEESKRISITILKAFLKCMPDNYSKNKITWPMMHFISTCCRNDCDLFDGLLLDLHHYTDDCIQQLFVGKTLHKPCFIISLNISLTVQDLSGTLPGNHTNTGNLTEGLNLYLTNFARYVIKAGISVVFNQKIVSDSLKYLFNAHNVLVIDRIGIQAMESLTKLTKTKTMSYINEDVDKCKGSIDSICTTVIGKKTFVYLQKIETSVCSLACYVNPLTIDDSKHVYWAALSTLDHTFRDQLVLSGGGFMEEYLANYLKNVYTSCDSQYFPCTRGQLLTCLHVFSSCLKSLIPDSFDSSSDRMILDCYRSKFNAMAVAIQTACVTLEIKYQIYE